MNRVSLKIVLLSAIVSTSVYGHKGRRDDTHPLSAKEKAATELADILLQNQAHATYAPLMKTVTATVLKTSGLEATKHLYDVAGEVGSLTEKLITSERFREIYRPATIHAYTEHFTLDELKALLAFYQSPLGKKLIDKGPAIGEMQRAELAQELPDAAKSLQSDVAKSVGGRLKDLFKKVVHD